MHHHVACTRRRRQASSVAGRCCIEGVAQQVSFRALFTWLACPEQPAGQTPGPQSPHSKPSSARSGVHIQQHTDPQTTDPKLSKCRARQMHLHSCRTVTGSAWDIGRAAPRSKQVDAWPRHCGPLACPARCLSYSCRLLPQHPPY